MTVDHTCLPTGVFDLAAHRRSKLRVVAGGKPEPTAPTCLRCHGSSRVKAGMVTDPDAAGSRSVWAPGVACSCPPDGPDGDAA